jgi:hypothetical protein
VGGAGVVGDSSIFPSSISLPLICDGDGHEFRKERIERIKAG